MGLLIYGSRKYPIGTFDPPFYKCPKCEELHTTYVVVYSICYHVYWIPVFPYQKDAIATCSGCGFHREEVRFGPALIKEFAEKKKDYKHPWWLYSFIILAISVIVLAIILPD
jgi:hypothetical protein